VTAGDSKPLRLVELMGPPGSGKSTVFELLLARDETIEERPTLRQREHAGIVATSLVTALATLAWRRAIARGERREQLQMMTYLQAMPRIFAASADGHAIVFDQGPLFFLTRPSLMSKRLQPWRRRMLDTWAPLLDLVVYLDSDDALLRERINNRQKRHTLKGADSRTTLEVLTSNRQVYERAIDDVAARPGGPAILWFDTSSHSADEIADTLLTAIAGDGRAVGAKRRGEPVRRRSAQ
jgi:thymidylate kinase